MRFAIALLVAMLGLAVACQRASASSLDELLAHVRSASGAPYDVHIASAAESTVDGENDHFLVDADGYRSLVRRCRADLCDGSYFDGSRIYTVNINGTTLPSSLHRDDSERALRAIATSAFASPDFAGYGGSVSEIGPQVRDGKTYRTLVVRVGSGVLHVLIDPTTFLPVEAQAADGSSAFALRDYRRVDRLMLPFEIWRDGKLLERYTSRHVVAGRLVAPAGLVPAFAGRASTVRFARLPGPAAAQPVVPCSIKGVTVNCLVDTGNSSLGMSLELAERLGLDVSGDYEVSGLGHYITGVVTAGPLVVGGATFPAAHYVVLHDLHDYGYDVVLGADVLAKSRVTLDYPAATATFGDPGVGEPPDIPLHFVGLLPVIDVQLGAQDVSLAIDTGDVASINLTYDFYADNPGLFQVRARRTVAGIGGTADQLAGEIGSVRIATIEATQQAIAATRTDEAAGSGHLGSAFLSHFTVTLDYLHGRLGLAPRPGDPSVRDTR